MKLTSIATTLTGTSSPPSMETKSGETKAAQSLQIDPKILAERKKAEKVAEEFESIFLDMMLKSMRKTAVGEEESNAQSIYKGMLDTEYAKTMSANRSFGIKTMILDWLEKNNHTQPATNATNGTTSPIPEAAVSKSQSEIQRISKNPDLLNLNSKMASEAYSLQSRLGSQ